MNKKPICNEAEYVAPVLRTHIVKVEGIICQSGSYDDWGGQGESGKLTEGNEYDLG